MPLDQLLEVKREELASNRHLQLVERVLLGPTASDSSDGMPRIHPNKSQIRIITAGREGGGKGGGGREG